MIEQSDHRSRLVGILGGMGPRATVDFYDKLVRNTPATQDQDHLRVVIWADPTVPSRQEALLGCGIDPSPWLREGIHNLMASGAEIIAAPCNTAHAYLGPLMADKPVEFLNIIDTTIEALLARNLQQVGLLATDGALASGLFQTALDAAAIRWVLPAPQEQTRLMSLVEAVKADQSAPFLEKRLDSLFTDLRRLGVDTMVAGCTELSTLLNGRGRASGADVIDPALELALKTINRATRSRNDRESSIRVRL